MPSPYKTISMLMNDMIREQTFFKYFYCIKKYCTPQMHAFAENPEKILAANARLMHQGPPGSGRSGRSTWKLELDGKSLFVKHYHIKGLVEKSLPFLRKPRAKIAWKNTHRLLNLGINTALPIAILEKRIGPIRQDTYYITEFIHGNHFRSYHDDNEHFSQNYLKVANDIVDIIARFDSASLRHGDLKATNIMISLNKPYFIDLDSLRHYKIGWRRKRGTKRDVERFMRNWQEKPNQRKLFYGLLREKGLI